MIKRFLPLFILCLCSVFATGQTPTAPTFTDYHVYNGPDVRMCTSTSWMAGTSIQALDAISQSNDVEFLCLNDALNIAHDGNFNLNPAEDPTPATAPGISYVIYDCPPSATGPDVDNIESDPCVANNPPPAAAYNFYLDGVVNIGGSGQFINSGALQGFFNGGNPIELYFAPITIHNHVGLSFETSGNNEFCVNANAADAFRVVYLNAITESNVSNNAGNSCTASFDIEGGLPQFDLSNYTITIEQSGNPAITGTVTSGPAGHISTVTFTVPSSGIYDVTVEDGKSCGVTFSVDMSACAPAVSATYTPSDITCNGANDGSIVIDISGGSPAFDIDWQLQPAGAIQSGTLPTGTQFTIPNLPPGTYDVTVTDNAGTQDNTTVTINEPGALGASLINLTQPTCNGLSDGSISVELSSGGVVIVPDASYSFNWGLPQTTQTITGIPSGPYAVTVTDGNNCTATASATLSQPSAISAPPITAVDASCIGIADGSATINAIGGTGILLYNWSTVPVQNTATASNLEPGTYTVTVTDDNSCSYTDNVTIGAATVLSALATPTNITCNGANDGEITVQEIVVGTDNGGYTYTWSPNVGATATINTLSANTYSVTISDANGCTATADAVISEPAVLTVSTTPVDESCTVGNDGSVSTTVMGGTPLVSGDYNYIWDTGEITPSITNLSGNTYTVTVTDNNSCTASAEGIVNAPNGPSIVDFTTVPLLCSTDTNGSLTVNATAGNDPITTYAWSNGPTTPNNDNLGPGTYTVTITDGGGCVTTGSSTIAQPAAITAPPITAVDASCVGVADGSATINTSGGTGILSYAWSTIPVQNTATGNNLEPGTYTVTVTDDNSCEYIDNVTIGSTTVLSAIATPTDITCNGANDGEITVQESVVGVDNGGYTYVWSPNVGTGVTVNALAPNTYSVTVSDINGCTATAEATINEPIALSVTTTPTNESCTVGNDGTVSTTVTGGTPLPGGTYNYTWNNSDVTSTINGLSGGTYTVTVTDANNCTATAEGIVNPPLGPTVNGFTVVGVQCATDMNGSLTVNAIAGNDPITGYAWSNGPTTPNNDNIGPGTYTVTITDGGGCITTATEVLTAPPALSEASPAVTTTPFCPGGGEGTITLDIVGGVLPYNYNWSNGSTGPAFDVLTNLIADTYTVTVTDANSCSFIVSDIIVNDPPAISELFTDIQPVSCFAGVPCDGSATITASGGLSTTYTFTWSSGETSTGGSSTATQLCQGDQSVTVTDGFCTVVFNMSDFGVEIPAPPIVSIADIQTTDVSCFGDTDGTATITPTGGDGGPYTINWSNGQTGATATNLVPNTNYNVSITDGMGCISVPFNVTVGEPQPLQLLIIDTIDITCNGDNDGIIQVAPTGGNQGTFTYQWSPNTSNTLNVASGLSAGIYSVTVTDENGCSATVSADVDEPSPIVFEYMPPVEPLCNGFTTVFGIDTVYGGVGEPYIYTIDEFNFQSTNQASQILAGTYTIEVSDASGCTATEVMVVDEPAPIIVDLGPDVEIQLGESYEIIPNVTPLGALDSLIWSPAIGLDCTDCFNPTASPIDDQIYSLTVIDEFGCFGSDNLFIDIDPNRNVYIPNAFTPNGDGANDFFAPYIGVGVDRINSILIFDRWGELVYQNNNFVPDPTGNTGWDGRLGGKLMNPAVFVYVIEVSFIDGQVLTYKGDVTLLK